MPPPSPAHCPPTPPSTHPCALLGQTHWDPCYISVLGTHSRRHLCRRKSVIKKVQAHIEGGRCPASAICILAVFLPCHMLFYRCTHLSNCMCSGPGGKQTFGNVLVHFASPFLVVKERCMLTGGQIYVCKGTPRDLSNACTHTHSRPVFPQSASHIHTSL